MRRFKYRGFTLLELVIVIAIIAIVASVAIPYFSKMERRNRVGNYTRRLVGHLRQARAEASTGKCTVDPGSAPCPTNSQVRSAGIRFKKNTDPDLCDAYEIFVDVDGVTNGNEVTVLDVDLLAQPGTQVRFGATVEDGGEIRFASNGVAEGDLDADGSPEQIEVLVQDAGIHSVYRITVTGVGLVSVVD